MIRIWTSRAVQAYLTVTVHFITDDWLINSNVLVTREMTERHTGVHIEYSLTEIAKDWNLDGKIVAIVHDNASNMVLASDLLEDWGDLPCFAHTLQLAVNAGLEINTIWYCLKATSQMNDYLCPYCARTRMRLERRNALNLSLYSAVESVSKLGSRRKPVCG